MSTTMIPTTVMNITVSASVEGICSYAAYDALHAELYASFNHWNPEATISTSCHAGGVVVLRSVLSLDSESDDSEVHEAITDMQTLITKAVGNYSLRYIEVRPYFCRY